MAWLELGELPVPVADLVVQFHGVAVVERLFLHIRRKFRDQIRKESKITLHLAAPFCCPSVLALAVEAHLGYRNVF